MAAKTITFKRGEDLDRIDALLSGTRIRNRMPEGIAGKRSAMTLWAIEYLTKLIDGGVDNLQSELFTNNSEEWEVITSENDRLKAENNRLQERVRELEGIEDGYIESSNEMSAMLDQRKEEVRSIRKTVDWFCTQIQNTPDYAEKLAEDLRKEVFGEK